MDLDEKGQAEAVFRLMIDSIIGLAILLIIISLISYFNSQVISQSLTDLQTQIQSAANSPDGTVIKSGDLTFAKGTVIDRVFAQYYTGQGAACFNFDAKTGSMNVIDKGDGPAGVEFTKTLTTKVYIKCAPTGYSVSCDPKNPPQNETECCFSCMVSFGKSLE